MLSQIKCIVWDGTSRTSYCRYNWDDESLLDFPAHGNYYERPTPLCPGCDTVASAATGSATFPVAPQDIETGNPFSVKTLLDFWYENMPYTGALLPGRPPLSRVLRVSIAYTVSLGATSPGPSTPSTVAVPARTFMSQT